MEAYILLALMGLLIAIGIIATVASARAKEKRRAYLMMKYGDPALVDRLMRKMFWVGQTGEQLIDSLGNPVDIDEKVLKTKRKAIWKYFHRGGNRFGLRITVENGQVIGWDEKL